MKEGIRPVGPHRPSCHPPEEAGFPSATFDTHPDRTSVEMSFSLTVSCMPAGVASTGVSVPTWCTSEVRLHSLPAITHRCSRSGQRGAGRQGNPVRPSRHFQVIVSSIEKASDGGIHQRRGIRGKQRRRNVLSARKGEVALLMCLSMQYRGKTTE